MILLDFCVNALNGLTSFLHNGIWCPVLWTEFGVNALNGLTSFLLPKGEKLSDGRIGCVNALNGLTSFLRFSSYGEITEATFVPMP